MQVAAAACLLKEYYTSAVQGPITEGQLIKYIYVFYQLSLICMLAARDWLHCSGPHEVTFHPMWPHPKMSLTPLLYVNLLVKCLDALKEM